jgi:hypothetical protein
LFLATAFALAIAPVVAHAALDMPSVAVTAIGHSKVAVNITAGPSGLPNGFAVYWMKQTDYDDYGDVWPDLLRIPAPLGPVHRARCSTRAAALHHVQARARRTISVEIGDLFDEGGLMTNDAEELEYTPSYGTDYVAPTPSAARAEAAAPTR